ncbi:Uncharacterised protein [Pseudomonas luteola]|uniref:Uncharacterized protein n=2 Tax=Pseudomonas TaxID=286 RepID=A0A2X2BYU6_PSELU|nr:Uncharacterised protein [Pseudomonas luteola]
MSFLRDLVKRINIGSSTTNVVANEGSVLIQGNNSGQINLNINPASDAEAITTAVSKGFHEQYLHISKEDTEKFQSEIDREIDEYREMMNSGKAKNALGLLEKLISKQEHNLTEVQKFRAKANIAICYLYLGDVVRAPRLLLEACSYAPEDRRAIANKVLALTLGGKIDEAIEFGSIKINDDPNNELLANFILQTTRIKFQNSKMPSDPYEGFTERVKFDKGVQIAHIHLLASQQIDGWKDLAAEFIEQYPDDAQVKNIIANDTLFNFVKQRQTTNGFTFTRAELDELKQVADWISLSWNSFKSSDHMADSNDLQNIENLLILYKLTDDIDSLKKESSYVLKKLHSDQRLIETTAKCLIHLKEIELFEQAVAKISDQAVAKRLTFLRMVSSKDWEGLGRVKDYQLEKFEDDFAIEAKVVVYIARAYLGCAQGKVNLEVLLRSTELGSRARLLLFEFGAESRVETVARLAHSYGLNRVSEDTDEIEFLHYMKLVKFLMLWDEIIMRLDVYRHASDNYELKHMLALSYLNEHPIRSEGVDFFKEKILPYVKGYELLAGLFYYKQNDFTASKELIELYLEEGGNDLYAVIVLSNIAKLDNDDAYLDKILNGYDIKIMSGTPEQRMHIARLKASIGKGDEALLEAFELLDKNQNSAQIWLGYFGIFLTASKTDALESTKVVGNNCYFKLVSSENEVIERNTDSNTADQVILTPDKVDYYVSMVWGKGVGFEFTVERLIKKQSWKLTEIKHQYLEAFHLVCREFEKRFPNEGGLWALKIENDNIQPLLDFMAAQMEQDETLIGQILEKHMPLAIAAGMSKKTVFNIRDSMIAKVGKINTCIGTHEERSNALNLIEKFKGRSVVLDAYTIWVVAELGLIESFKAYFESIIISHSILHELKVMAANEIAGLTDGQFSRENILKVIKNIESNCEVITYNFSRSLDDLSGKLLEISQQAVAPYFITKERGALFVSEDAFSRSFAQNIYQINESAWLQPVIMVLGKQRLLSAQEYTEKTIELARRKHSFVSINFFVLEHAYQADDTNSLSRFFHLVEFIGGTQAELESSYKVILRFIIQRWILDYNPGCQQAVEDLLSISHGDAFPTAKAMKATSLLLNKLVATPGGLEKLNELSNYPILRLRKFIHEWYRGHFFSF